MNILIISNSRIPAHLYGGIERVIWGLGKELAGMGHQVTYLVQEGSTCPFADVIPLAEGIPLLDQIPEAVDVVHGHYLIPELASYHKPYLITLHGNYDEPGYVFDSNLVFISRNQAERYGSRTFVYNGLDWEGYTPPDLRRKRNFFHFLGKAAWRVKNVKGAIRVIRETRQEKLRVLGGVRFNFKMGVRLTFSPRVRFHGMVGGVEKDRLLNQSRGLIFPVRWHEPFGLAIIESLFYGCPVFGTPYGSLTELVGEDFGFLSARSAELAEAVEHWEAYDPKRCHEYALTEFNSRKMTRSYLELYERVLAGESLNETPPRVVQVPKGKFLAWD
jgi:glycosyltransferase involved in cell wall biosynthesis